VFLKEFRPVTSSLRSRRLVSKKFLNLKYCNKLRLPMIDKAGRGSAGLITIRHRGGGVFSFFKVVDFYRYYSKESYLIDRAYDKRRNCFIGLYKTEFGSLRYLLLPDDMPSKSVFTSFSLRGYVDCLGDTMPIG